MDILVPDHWLRDFLKTSATPKQIAEYLSLCGPSVERVDYIYGNPVFKVDITTNRVDSASVYGIAREASAILPRFGIKARIQSISVGDIKFSKKVKYLEAIVDKKLCPRFTAVLIKNVNIKPSAKEIQDKLKAVGVRPINNVIDISNYVMHELGQPVHTFDYDKILERKMLLRESRKGEKLKTLDGKTHVLPGGDIVIEDGKKRLIDLAGIMGGENSAVDANTKNVLLFVQTYNPLNIRRTSMSLAKRSEAAVLFEKELDPELVSLGIWRAIELFVKLTGGIPEKEILDLYPNPYKAKRVTTRLGFIEDKLGVLITKNEISKILVSLGFETSWKGKKLEVLVPSYRARDIEIQEDIIEEIARLFGYHNLPSRIMEGSIPEPSLDSPFSFEKKAKEILKGVGGIEVYTLSFVSKEKVNKNVALSLTNPLGSESKYLRMSLVPSLVQAIRENLHINQPIHLFEMANVYLPRKNDLPEEKMILAGVMKDYTFREAKGIVEGFLQSLNTSWTYKSEDSNFTLPSQRLLLFSRSKEIGNMGNLETDNLFYYEFDVESLRTSVSPKTYRHIPKYPAQIEDITLKLPAKTKVGELIGEMQKTSKIISWIELKGIFEDSYTFRIWYQHPLKTLTDKEVEGVRMNLIENVKKRFGANLKS